MNENNKMNAMLDKSTDEFIDFDKLEAQLEDELEDQMSDLQFLESEREQIGNPEDRKSRFTWKNDQKCCLGTIFKSGRCYCRRRFY